MKSTDAGRALHETEERLRWALQAAQGGAWDWDLTRDEAWWSAEMYELWGVEPGTRMGLDTALPLILEQDRDQLLTAIDTAISRNGDYQCEFRIRHPVRGERWMDSRGRLVHDPSGRPVRMLGISLDVTERKQAEEALLRRHEALEEGVKERTIALEQAKRQAENANAFKSRFLAAANHDLRQPLQSVSLYVSVLSRLLSPPQQEVCAKIRNSLDTMRELLDALLDVSKLESGAVEPERQDFVVQEFLDRIVIDSLPLVEEKGLRLVCPPTDCVVHSDPALLQRVIENFVSNAVRYTEHGAVTIECRQEGSAAWIEVTDTGIGIPEHALENIFEEYYQLDNPIRDRSRGLGLGLAIAKYVARVLGHRLHVHSVLGEGSAFAVEVPLGKAIGHSVAPPTRAEVPERARSPAILLIEDDPAIIDATTMLLESAGIRVHSALSGDDALAKLQTGIGADVVITDYRLPGCTGIEVIRRLRQATADDLPAILVTGDTSAQEVESVDLANCTVLYKPINAERLMSLVDSLTGPKPAL